MWVSPPQFCFYFYNFIEVIYFIIRLIEFESFELVY